MTAEAARRDFMKSTICIMRHWMSITLFALAAVGSAAHADTILVDKNVMVTAPSVPKIESLVLSSAGSLAVTVTDMTWPQVFQSLSFAITDNVGVLKSSATGGTLLYDVTGPMTLFANVYGVPDQSAGTGLYHIKASFVPAVPLPAAAWLLLSGLAGFGGLKTKHKNRPSSSRREHAAVTDFIVQ